MVVGGADLASSFMRHDLIDEFALFVHPVVIGSGHPLFSGLKHMVQLDLIDTRRFGNGVVMLRYLRARGPS